MHIPLRSIMAVIDRHREQDMPLVTDVGQNVFKNGNTASDTINNLASEAYRKLTSTQTTPMGKINFGYKASVVRKKGEINTAVIAALKDMINNNNNAASGQIMYKEM